MAGEANVLSMLAMYQQDVDRQRQEKIRLRKEREEQERRRKLEILETQDYYNDDLLDGAGSGTLTLPPVTLTKGADRDNFKLP